MLKRILIAGDLEHVRNLVRSLLQEECGFRVCGEAVDGFGAIEKARKIKPDLIILDVSMPRIGKIEAAPRLKTLLPQTPIILFTLHGGLLRGCDTREIGVDAGVAKQDGLSALGDSIHTLFARSPVNRTAK